MDHHYLKWRNGELVDSGKRTHYDTGAERETGGKGRCDLLPLAEASYLFDDGGCDELLYNLELYMRNGNEAHIYRALHQAVDKCYGGNVETALLEASYQFEDGARKYSDRNWEKGLPQHCYIDSAVRHYLKWRRGDQDEPHDRAVMFNLLAAAWNHRYHPELNDLPFADTDALQCKCDTYCDGACGECDDADCCDSDKRHKQANACVCCGGPTDQPGILCDACKELD